MAHRKQNRSHQVKQILRTMECQYQMYSESGIWVDGGLWHLSLPEDEPKSVYLGFIPQVGRDLIADVTIRFTGSAVLQGLEVYSEGTVAPDSTSAVAGWIEQINRN
jgi:hypothetical protein